MSLLGPITILAHMFSGLLLLSLGRHGKLCPVLDHPFDLGKHLCPFRELVYNLSEILDCPIASFIMEFLIGIGSVNLIVSLAYPAGSAGRVESYV